MPPCMAMHMEYSGVPIMANNEPATLCLDIHYGLKVVGIIQPWIIFILPDAMEIICRDLNQIA